MAEMMRYARPEGDGSRDKGSPNTATEIIFVVEEAPEGGYSARALGFSIFTEADTIEELRVRVREAVECHFEDERKPRVIRLHVVREEVFAA